MEYDKEIMSLQEIQNLGFPRKYLERAYRGKNNTFAFKENPEKSRNKIFFDTSWFEQWRKREIKAQILAR